jgi:predicted RNase H-like nuclease (RuvC/YqgF family)
MAAAEIEYLTLAEFVEQTNRSRAWILKDENKATLLANGAELGGRGQGSKIPATLVESLGWKKEKSVSAPKASTSETSALAEEIASLEAEFEDAKEKAATYGAIIKEKKAELSKIEKTAEREAAKAAKQELRAEEKRLAKLREEFEASRDRVAELSKAAG